MRWVPLLSILYRYETNVERISNLSKAIEWTSVSSSVSANNSFVGFFHHLKCHAQYIFLSNPQKNS